MSKKLSRKLIKIRKPDSAWHKSYFSVAVIKHRDQGNIQRSYFDLQFHRAESITLGTAGSRQEAWRVE